MSMVSILILLVLDAALGGIQPVSDVRPPTNSGRVPASRAARATHRDDQRLLRFLPIIHTQSSYSSRILRPLWETLKGVTGNRHLSDRANRPSRQSPPQHWGGLIQ